MVPCHDSLLAALQALSACCHLAVALHVGCAADWKTDPWCCDQQPQACPPAVAQVRVPLEPAELQCLRTAAWLCQESWHHQRRKAGQLAWLHHPEKLLQKLLGPMPPAAALLGQLLWLYIIQTGFTKGELQNDQTAGAKEQL